MIVKDEKVIVEDLRSTNGTFVNRRQVDNPVQVRLGDVIKFDSAAFHLVIPDSGNSTLVMRNLGSTSEMPTASSIVIEGSKEENAGNETVVHSSFPYRPTGKKVRLPAEPWRAAVSRVKRLTSY
ncbi:MAG: pSer/pThr/pTyr-binding forkhead associated (FHA) protein [Bacteroidia bacterium]